MVARTLLDERLALPSNQPFAAIEDGRALAQAIVDTIREPLLVLDKDLRVVAASRSFYLTFKMVRQDVQGRPVYTLGDGQWNIPELRLLLEKIVPQDAVMEEYEVERLARDAKLMELGGGTTEIQELTIARHLVGG